MGNVSSARSIVLHAAVYVLLFVAVVFGWRMLTEMARRTSEAEAALDRQTAAALAQARTSREQLKAARAVSAQAQAAARTYAQQAAVAGAAADVAQDTADALHRQLKDLRTAGDSLPVLVAENTSLRVVNTDLRSQVHYLTLRGDSLESDGRNAWAQVAIDSSAVKVLQDALVANVKFRECRWAFRLLPCPSRGAVAILSAAASATLTAVIISKAPKAAKPAAIRLGQISF